jgi:hypothetical protein
MKLTQDAQDKNRQSSVNRSFKENVETQEAGATEMEPDTFCKREGSIEKNKVINGVYTRDCISKVSEHGKCFQQEAPLSLQSW